MGYRYSPGATIIRFGSPECKILSGKDLASSKPEVYNTFTLYNHTAQKHYVAGVMKLLDAFCKTAVCTIHASWMDY